MVARVEAFMPREKRNDISVKIEAAIYRRAKMVAAYRDITLAEYLSALLEKPVDRDYQKLTEQMSADQQDSKGDN
jgi:hypothetical protein